MIGRSGGEGGGDSVSGKFCSSCSSGWRCQFPSNPLIKKEKKTFNRGIASAHISQVIAHEYRLLSVVCGLAGWTRLGKRDRLFVPFGATLGWLSLQRRLPRPRPSQHGSSEITPRLKCLNQSHLYLDPSLGPIPPLTRALRGPGGRRRSSSRSRPR